jgi:hypothetical protein
MDDVKEVATLLFELFPGFVAARILYGLSSYPKPSQFERLAQALVLSFIVRVLAIPEQSILIRIGKYHAITVWDGDSQLLAATITGVAIGLFGSYFAQNDWLYSLARKLKLTTRTAYPSEWFGAFNRTPRFVVLHLKDTRRILGWPLQWPSDSAIGHFELVKSSWLPTAAAQGQDAGGNDRGAAVSTGVNAILVPVAEVTFVEFLES